MGSEIFLADKYVAVTSLYVRVKYDSHVETIDIADVQSVKVTADRIKDWRKLQLLAIALNLITLVLLLLSINTHGIWDWVRSFAILGLLPLNTFFGRALRDSTLWTLTLETISGPVNILVSPSGTYLSKVRRAINKAIKARDSILQSA